MKAGEFNKCPKCGGEMKSGTTSENFRILKQGDMMGDRANVLYCGNCGYVELYKEASSREPRRWRTPPASAQTPPSEEPQEPQEESKRRIDKRLVR